MALQSGDPVVLVMGADGLPVAGKACLPESGDPIAILFGADGLPVATGGKNPIAAGDPGFIVFGADGLPIFFPFCGESAACPNGWPEILATVTGASGTITWCGETWILPDDSGETRSICPSTYRRVLYGGPTMYDALHTWEYRGLVLGRFAGLRKFSTFTYGYYWLRYFSKNFNRLSVKWLAYSRRSFAARGTAIPLAPTATNTTGFGTLNLISGVAAPSYFDYSMDANFFGSYVSGGVTYSWAKGSGW